MPAESPDASPAALDSLGDLAHELGNMLDGSMRWLLLADRTLQDEGSGKAGVAREQIDRVQQTLSRMSGLVDSAMRSGGSSIGSPVVASAVSLGEAIDHAVDVIRPRAGALGAAVHVRIEPDAGRAPAGALYSVILNGLTNALDAIDRCGAGAAPGGLVEVGVRMFESPGCEPMVELTICDDGSGIAPEQNGAWAFVHGNTGHTSGHGVGLALAKRIVDEMRGTIALDGRLERGSSVRPGAVLSVRVPMPVSPTAVIGGEDG